jgi:hypothetical protein
MTPQSTPCAEAPPPGLTADQKLNVIVEYLIGADEALRQATVAAVLQAPHGSVRQTLINRLVAALGSRGAVTRRQAAASLAAFGRVAVPALVLALGRGRGTALRVRAAALLGVIGPGLGTQDRNDLLLELYAAVLTAPNGDVAQACAQAFGAVARAGRTGPASTGIGTSSETPAGAAPAGWNTDRGQGPWPGGGHDEAEGDEGAALL